MRVSRRLVAVPFALVLAGSLAACGGSSPEASGPATTPVVQEAPAVEDAAFELTTESFPDLFAAVSAATTYNLTANIGAAGAAITMTAAVDGTNMAISETIPSLAAPIEIRLIDGAVYANLGDMTGGLFWQIDLTDTSNPMAVAMSEATKQVSAADSIAALEPAISSISPAGAPEVIDGVSTQGYAVVVDTTKLGGQSADQLAAAAAQGVVMPTTITYTYWVGADKLPRKMTMDLMGTTTEMLFSNWGGAVTVEAPTADQITTTPPAM